MVLLLIYLWYSYWGGGTGTGTGAGGGWSTEESGETEKWFKYGLLYTLFSQGTPLLTL